MKPDTNKGRYSPELDEPHETNQRADDGARDGEADDLEAEALAALKELEESVDDMVERLTQHFDALLRGLKADRNKWRIEAMKARPLVAQCSRPGSALEGTMGDDEWDCHYARWKQARDRNRADAEPAPEIKTAANHGLYTEPAPEIPPTDEVLGNAVQMPDMTAIERIERALELGPKKRHSRRA